MSNCLPTSVLVRAITIHSWEGNLGNGNSHKFLLHRYQGLSLHAANWLWLNTHLVNTRKGGTPRYSSPASRWWRRRRHCLADGQFAIAIAGFRHCCPHLHCTESLPAPFGTSTGSTENSLASSCNLNLRLRIESCKEMCWSSKAVYVDEAVGTPQFHPQILPEVSSKVSDYFYKMAVFENVDGKRIPHNNSNRKLVDPAEWRTKTQSCKRKVFSTFSGRNSIPQTAPIFDQRKAWKNAQTSCCDLSGKRVRWETKRKEEKLCVAWARIRNELPSVLQNWNDDIWKAGTHFLNYLVSFRSNCSSFQ